MPRIPASATSARSKSWATGAEGKRHIGIFGMVVVGFFWVSGGIYGNAEILAAAPPGVVMLMTIVIPLMFALPVALIVAELSAAFPLDGGQVVWVQKAWGPFIGRQNSFWVFIVNATDAAVYPLLAAQFFQPYLPNLDWITSRAIGFVMILMVTCMNLVSMDWIVRFSTLLCVITLVPCLIYTGISLQYLDWAAVTSMDIGPHGEVDYAVLVSWTLWLYSGFSSLGVLAGEIENPARTFIGTIVILLPIVAMLNILPFAASVSYHRPSYDCFLPDGAASADATQAAADNQNVTDGYGYPACRYAAGEFGVLAGEMAGTWLRDLFFASSNLTLLGLYNSQALAASMTLSFAFEQSCGPAISRLSRRRWCGYRCTRWLFKRRGDGARKCFIIATALLTAFFTLFPYDTLMQLEMSIYSLSKTFFLAAFMHFRIYGIDVDRPFKIPGGVVGGALICIVPFLVVAANTFCIFFTSHQQDGEIITPPPFMQAILDIPCSQLVCFLVVVGLGLLPTLPGCLHRRGCHLCCCCCKGSRRGRKISESDYSRSRKASNNAQQANGSRRKADTTRFVANASTSLLAQSENVL